MIIMKRRSHLVSFRMSEDEYDRLRRACVATGSRSVSDLARSAIGNMVCKTLEPGESDLLDRIRNLEATMIELRAEISQHWPAAATGEPQTMRAAHAGAGGYFAPEG